MTPDDFDGYSQDFLDARQSDLQQRHDDITGRSREALAQIMDTDREVGDSVDTSNEEQDTSTMLKLQDREARILRTVEHALTLLADEVYGECETCGEFINPKRLVANPMATHCIDCQAELEEAARRLRTRPGLIDEYM